MQAAALRTVIAERRDALRGGTAVDIGADAILAAAGDALAEAARPSLRPVLNLTGTVLHTNLGRAALPQEALDAIITVASGASNLEYDLETAQKKILDAKLPEGLAARIAEGR